MTVAGRVHAALSLPEKDPFQPLALIIKHPGFGRSGGQQENHRKLRGSTARKQGHTSGLVSTLNA